MGSAEICSASRGSSDGRLSDRELDVLPLLAGRMDNGRDRRTLFMAPTTVRHHVWNIFAKLGVETRSGRGVGGAPGLV